MDSIPAKLSRESCCVSCCASRNSQSKADATGSWAGKHEIVRTDLHSDILALGEEELKKFQMEVEATTQKRLRDEFADECRKLEAEKRFTIGRNAEELHSRYEEFFKSAQEELKEKLQVDMRIRNLTQ